MTTRHRRTTTVALASEVPKPLLQLPPNTLTRARKAKRQRAQRTPGIPINRVGQLLAHCLLSNESKRFFYFGSVD